MMETPDYTTWTQRKEAEQDASARAETLRANRNKIHRTLSRVFSADFKENGGLDQALRHWAFERLGKGLDADVFSTISVVDKYDLPFGRMIDGDPLQSNLRMWDKLAAHEFGRLMLLHVWEAKLWKRGSLRESISNAFTGETPDDRAQRKAARAHVSILKPFRVYPEIRKRLFAEATARVAANESCGHAILVGKNADDMLLDRMWKDALSASFEGKSRYAFHFAHGRL